MSGPETSTPEQIDPRSELLNEYVGLITELLQTATLTDDPREKIALVSQRFLSLHQNELTREQFDEIFIKQRELMTKLRQEEV